MVAKCQEENKGREAETLGKLPSRVWLMFNEVIDTRGRRGRRHTGRKCE